MQNNRPRNDKGHPNGKWVVYHNNGQLHFIKNYIDGVRYGYFEYHRRTGKITYHYYAR
jgi:antitoxin component YwqK of YwqJK toxin-antitoxin module